MIDIDFLLNNSLQYTIVAPSNYGINTISKIATLFDSPGTIYYEEQGLCTSKGYQHSSDLMDLLMQRIYSGVTKINHGPDRFHIWVDSAEDMSVISLSKSDIGIVSDALDISGLYKLAVEEAKMMMQVRTSQNNIDAFNSVLLRAVK
jgi:hypothetical protein